MPGRLGVLTLLFLVSIGAACHRITPPRVVDRPSPRARVRLTPSTIPAPVPSMPAGLVPGTFTPDGSGAATYDVPIAVPPGTAGVQPSLALTYNSHRENGYAGMGWQLNGLSAIGRCGATYDLDGYKAGVAFDARDRFCLDGNRLVAISGAYGADGTVYHTAHETQTSVISHGTCGNGPCSFSAYNKDGHHLSFGGTADARILAQGRGDGTVRTWAVDRQTDLNGNYSTVAYSSDVATGEYFPLRIDYTGNEVSSGGLAPQRRVDFAYEARGDSVRRYLGGSLVRVTKRLRSITTSVGGRTIRSYTLGYDTSAFTLRSRLISITECDGAGVCLPPATFQWQTEPGRFASGPTLPGPLYVLVNGRVQPMGILQDLDGDGIADYSVATEFLSGTVTRDLTVWRGKPDGTFVQAGFSLPGPVFRASSTTVVMCGVLQDINGDAILDYSPATSIASTGAKDLSVYLGTRSGFTKASFTLPDAVYWQVNNQTLQTGILADMNGDGIPDYSRATRITSTGQSLLSIWKGTGSGFVATGQSLPGPLFAVSASTSMRTGVLQDIDGDGIADYSPATVTASTGVSDLDVWVGQTPGFTFTKSFRLPGQLLWVVSGQSLDSGLLVDLNGDGIPDYSRATEITSTGQKILDVYLGTGAGFVDSGFDLPGPVFLLSGTRADVDGVLTQINGDGTSRYSRATRFASTGVTQLDVWLGSGEGFRTASFTMPEPLFEVVNQQVHAKGVYEDLNGDGMTDFANTTCTMARPGVFTNCSLAVRLAEGPFSDLLAKVTNGFGGTTTVEYAPISDPEVYSRGDTPAYPVRDAQSSMYALSRYVSADSRGASYAFSFDYTGARFDVLGRNWLGFTKIVTTEEAGGRQAETIYSMAAPFYGLATGTAVRAGDGTTLETTTNTYADFAPADRQALGIHEPLQTSYVNTIDQDGAPSFSYGRDYDYDRYGNAIFEGERGDPSTGVLPVYHCARYANDDAPRVNRLGYELQKKSTRTAEACRSFLAVANGDEVRWDPATDLRWFTTSYDARFNVLSEGSWDDSHARFITSTYTVDPYGNTITITGPNGATTTYTYEATYHTFLQQITNPALTRADGTTYALASSYVTDPAFGTVVQTVDANGNVMQQDLDGFGRAVAAWGPDPEGRLVMLVSTLWHHQQGRHYLESRARPTWTASDDVATWYWTRTIFDGLEREFRTEQNGLRGGQPATIVTENFFDAQGRVHRQAVPHYEGDPVPVITTEFDAMNRPLSIADPGGVKERFVYENGGLRVTRTRAYDTPVATTSIQYLDSEGRTIRSVAPNGQERSFAYDSLGQPVSMASAPLVRESRPTFDSMGRLRSMTRTDSGTSTWVYDQTNRIRTITDASGNTISYDSYDALDRVLQRRTVYAGGASQWNATYDETAYRNGLSHPTTVAVQAPLLGTATYHYAYGPYDNELAADATLLGTTYHYATLIDPLTRPIERIDPAGGVLALRYGADGSLARIDVTEPGQPAPQTYATLTNYTALGELQDLSVDANGVSVARRYYPDTVAIGKLQSIDARSTRQADASLASLTYHWNALGEVTQIADNRDAAQTQTFGYEDQQLNRGMGFLTSARGGYGAKAWQYEQLGNVTRQDATTYTYKSGTDQLEGSSGGTTWEFSANGFLRTRTAVGHRDQYTFDADGNLVGIARSPADGSGTAAPLLDAAYDHTGRKVLETTSGGPAVLSVTEDYEVTTLAGGAVQHTRTIEGPWGPLAAITAAGDGVTGVSGASQRLRVRSLMPNPSSFGGRTRGALLSFFAFVLAPQTLRGAGFALAGLIFAAAMAIALLPLARRRASTAFQRSSPFFARITPAVAALVFLSASMPLYAELGPGGNGAGVPAAGRQFFVQNLVASTIAVTNDQGRETARVAYEPFGAVDQPSSSGVDDFRPKFSARPFEPSNGLYDFTARRFDPHLGRFIAPDPLDQFVSPYLYGGSDPVSMVDPDGEFAFTAAIVFGAAVLGAYFGAASVNNDFNPADWNWQSGTTWAGIFGGAALGAAGAAAGGLVVQVGVAVGSMGGTAAQIAGIAIGIAGEALVGAGENAAFTALGGASGKEVMVAAVTGAVFGAVFGGASGAIDQAASRAARAGDSFADDGAPMGSRAMDGGDSEAQCSCGCASFVAGTPVVLGDGSRKAIDRVAVGDSLIGRGVNRGDVQELVRHETHEIVRVTLASGERIDTTPEHLFYVDRSGWVPAAHLSPGALLATASGTPAIVAGVEKNHEPQSVTVYNFEVSPTGTYHVGQAGVLVHNAKGKNGWLCKATFLMTASQLKETWNGPALKKRFPAPGEYTAAVKELRQKEVLFNKLLRSSKVRISTRAQNPARTASPQYVRKVWVDEKGTRARQPKGIRATINKLRPNPFKWDRDVDEVIPRILGGLTIREGVPENQRFANALLNYASGGAIGALARRLKRNHQIRSFKLVIQTK
jgi:RHS repeat-associated protein